MGWRKSSSHCQHTSPSPYKTCSCSPSFPHWARVYPALPALPRPCGLLSITTIFNIPQGKDLPVCGPQKDPKLSRDPRVSRTPHNILKAATLAPPSTSLGRHVVDSVTSLPDLPYLPLRNHLHLLHLVRSAPVGRRRPRPPQSYQHRRSCDQNITVLHEFRVCFPRQHFRNISNSPANSGSSHWSLFSRLSRRRWLQQHLARAGSLILLLQACPAHAPR